MRTTLTCLGSILLLGLTACSGDDDNSPPKLDTIPSQTASVGTQLAVALRATDPDGDPVTFSFKSDISDLGTRAWIDSGAGGTAVFKWIPIGSDVGVHPFDFIASDGTDKARQTVEIDVKSAAAGEGSPVFIKPLGTGTTLDLTTKDQVEVPIVIGDADSTQVTIEQEAPLIDGATLDQTDGLVATWTWKPTPEQISGGELFTLSLSANDDDHPKVIKDFLIVLQKPTKSDCPGGEPVIVHAPGDQSTNLDIVLQAKVTDDKGLKFPPLLMYSDTDPGPTPDFSKLTQLTMDEVEGSPDQYKASIPNPVADKPAGTTAKLWYLIVANDNDDAEGDCDHQVRSPDKGAHSMTVTNSSTGAGLQPCATCSSDTQCGGPNDDCIIVGGDKVCGKACSGDGDCPATHDCSPSPVVGVGGKTSKQCVPTAGKCGSTTPTCTDDNQEDNDTLTQVKTKPGLAAGTYQMKSCPGSVFDDEDWYPIDITADATVTATLAGGAASNLDLMLKDSTGKVIVSSAKPGSVESLSSCLTPGRYYLHVWAWSKAENSYSFTWSKQAGSCASQCVDDSSDTGGKNDDNKSQARVASVSSAPYKSAAQQICAWDDDWYKVFMVKDETINATLKFTQAKFTEDLDLYLYDTAGVQLTKCTETDPDLCDSANGQSSTSNEKLTWKIPTTGDYYVVVHGWEGAQNKYDICIDYTSTTKTTNGCPPL